MDQFKEIIAIIGYAIESVGVLVILVGFLWATLKVIKHYTAGSGGEIYHDYRRNIARSIILGLEFLIAGDIIRTIIVSDTLSSVGVLAMIIALRTFLAFTLHVELEGRWPWQEATHSIKGPMDR